MQTPFLLGHGGFHLVGLLSCVQLAVVAEAVAEAEACVVFVPAPS